MGNKQAKSYKPLTFDKDNWHEISNLRPKTSPNQGVFRLFRNNLTSEDIQEYQLFFHSQSEFDKYIEFLQWREREDNIVSTKFFNHEQTKQFCKTNHSAKVYVQHIPVRLSDIQDIPFPQNLYLLYSALDGFEKLYRTVGYFHISEELVCMDRDGQVKVWLNPDLSKCHPFGSSFSDEATNSRQTDRLQQQMVNQIVKLVESNTVDEIEASTTFSQYLKQTYKGRGLGFHLAKQQLLNYAKKQETDIPNYFQSVIGIFEEEHITEHEDISNQHASYHYPTQHHELGDHPDKLGDYQWNSQLTPHYRNYDQDHQIYEVQYKDQAKRTSAEQLSYKILQKVPSHERFTVDNNSRPPTYAQNYYTQKGQYVDGQSRAYTPIQTLPTLPFGTSNKSNLKIKFNYQGNASSFSTGFTVPTYKRASLTSTPIVPIGRNLMTGASSQNDANRQILQPWVKQRRLPRTSSLKDLVHNNKLVYFDTRQVYELDPEITRDMLNYLSQQTTD